MVLFVIFHKVVTAFESVYEIIKCKLNQWALLCFVGCTILLRLNRGIKTWINSTPLHHAFIFSWHAPSKISNNCTKKKSSFESAVGWVYFPHLQNKNWKDNFFPVVWWWQIRDDLWIEVYYFERPFDGTVSGPNRSSFSFAISPGDLGRGFRPRFRLGNHSNVGVTYSTPLDHFVVYHFIVCWYSNERTI